MAHFVELDENNVVIRGIVVANAVLEDKEFPESEPIGIDFIYGLIGEGVWKQTSYNNNFRKNYAGVGYTYDSQRDAFIPPKPAGDWVLNEETCQWAEA